MGTSTCYIMPRRARGEILSYAVCEDVGWVLVSESRCNGNTVPSVRSPVVDEEQMRSVDDFSWLCFDAVGWVTGRTSSL